MAKKRNVRKPRLLVPSKADRRLRLVQSGIDTGHIPGFTIDRPHGWTDYLFLRFRSPMELLTTTGFETAEEDDCLIYPPGQPQWYRGRGEPFHDDWMHIDGTLVAKLLERYHVPIGRVFTVQGGDFFPVMLSDIRRISLFKQRFWEDELALVFESFIVRLARAHSAKTQGPISTIPPQFVVALQSTRMAIGEDLRRKWSVHDMAKLAGLGPSRFTLFYRTAFGTSPTDDLIQTRIDRSSWLLKTSDLSLNEIAEECGFSSVYYFIRQFRKRLGTTPGRFRLHAGKV